MSSFIRYQGRILLKGVDALSKYYSIHEFSKIIGVSAQTLRNWDANGKIGYCRVSNHKQKDDLERQIDNVKEYLLAKGQPAKKLIRELIQEEADGKSHKSNADTK